MYYGPTAPPAGSPPGAGKSMGKAVIEMPNNEKRNVPMLYPKIDLSETPSLRQLVYDNLLKEIMNNNLPPGTRLMEAEISEAMNVSRAPIREALAMLERDGFTKIIPHKGSIVSEITLDNVLEIWEIRKLIEPYSAKVSCQFASPAEVKVIKRALDRLESNPTSLELYKQTDRDVHDLLSKYLPNTFLKSMLNNVTAHSTRMRWYVKSQVDLPEYWLTSIREHQQIIDAVMEGDPDKIEKTVHSHLVNSEKRILNNMNTQNI